MLFPVFFARCCNRLQNCQNRLVVPSTVPFIMSRKAVNNYQPGKITLQRCSGSFSGKITSEFWRRWIEFSSDFCCCQSWPDASQSPLCWVCESLQPKQKKRTDDTLCMSGRGCCAFEDVSLKVPRTYSPGNLSRFPQPVTVCISTPVWKLVKSN